MGVSEDKKIIYMDNAATTPVLPEVLEAMLPYYTEIYGNASGIYSVGQSAKKALEEARAIIARSINAKKENIYFTSGGSESDNWALKMVAKEFGKKGKHIITSKIEHHAILHSCNVLEEEGYEITYVNVDENGIIKLDELKNAIRQDTILISIMFANNEIGSVQPIEQIGKIARDAGIIFHTDAVQAYTQLPIDVEKMNIDMLSTSAHKINGPKGVGFLYINENIKIRSFINGGAQERNKRAGTENIPGIVGFAKAAQISVLDMEERCDKECKLRDYFIDRVLSEIPYARLNGDRYKRLPNNINFSFQFIEGESLLIMLDMEGICASSGSACTSGSIDPSHVLMALGLPEEIAHGSIRFTLGRMNTKEQVDIVIEHMKKNIANLRSMSDSYEKYIKR